MFKKLLSVFLFSIPLTLQAYQSMYEKTPVGKIKVIELPERLALEAKTDGTYFDKDNGLFRKLFRYISTNDVAMTTPVEADMNPGKMRFFVHISNNDWGATNPGTDNQQITFSKNF